MARAYPIPFFEDPTTPGKPLTLSGTQYSRIIDLWYLSAAGIFLIWTGTPTATLTNWTTNIEPRLRDDTADTDWEQDPTTYPASPAGGAGNTMLHIDNIRARYFRTKSVLGSGSGALRGYAEIKVT